LAALAGFYLVKSFVLSPKLVQGQKAPELKGPLPDGSKFNLHDLKGQYILLDFWGSWCGPCIESHPALVEVYNQFHDKAFTDASNFEIVSVAVENNDKNWAYIIQRDHLNWKYHLLATNLFESDIVKTYSVKQLPTRFLINPKGIIIAVDPSISQVAGTLTSHLKS
jgi:thiol-disulfide isomerase/thioredoxin